MYKKFKEKLDGKIDECFIESVRANDGLIEYWLNYGANVNTVGNNGITALIHAACNGDIKTVTTLINRKADVDFKASNRTALMWACTLGYYEIVEILLQNGADPNLVVAKFSALKAACGRNHVDILELLLKYEFEFYKEKFDAAVFFVEASSYSKEIVECLINKGFDINSQDKEGKTALMNAVECTNISVVQLLLERGANLDIRDNKGFTALDYLYNKLGKENLEVLLILEKVGAKKGKDIVV